MSRLFLTLIFSLAIFALVQSGSEDGCPKNEVLSPCNGHCQKTCKNPNPICLKICVEGCICKEGYLRNAKGRCVRPRCCRRKDKPSDKSSSEESDKSSSEKRDKSDSSDESKSSQKSNES